MKTDMELFKIGSGMNTLAELFNEYLEQTADKVTGDVVLRCIKSIDYTKQEAERLMGISRTHSIIINEETDK